MTNSGRKFESNENFGLKIAWDSKYMWYPKNAIKWNVQQIVLAIRWGLNFLGLGLKRY